MNTNLKLSEPGSMVSAGLDAEGTAHTILVDSTGRVVCVPQPASSDPLVAICVVFVSVFVLGYVLGVRLR